MPEPSEPGGPRRRPKRTVLLAVLAWVGVVTATSAAAWLAIGSAGSDVLGLASRSVPGASGASPAAVSPPPPISPSVGPSAGPSAGPPPAATPVDEVRSVTGGQVGVRCTGDRITLRFAQPATGWLVRRESEDGRVRIEFETSGQRTRVEARCVAGGPRMTVEAKRGGGDGGGSGGND